MYQSYTNENRFRMDGAAVSVFNETGSPILCGAIKINDVLTVKGQTYAIDCDLVCGDGIIVSVNREDGKERCIHLFEVIVTGYTYNGRFYITRFVIFFMSRINFGILVVNCSIPYWPIFSPA